AVGGLLGLEAFLAGRGGGLDLIRRGAGRRGLVLREGRDGQQQDGEGAGQRGHARRLLPEDVGTTLRWGDVAQHRIRGRRTPARPAERAEFLSGAPRPPRFGKGRRAGGRRKGTALGTNIGDIRSARPPSGPEPTPVASLERTIP